MARSICASWSLDSLGPASGLKPMPLGDSADKPGGARGWWADLSMGMKALFVLVVMLVIAGISVGIAAGAGAFKSAESDITLRTLTNNCTDTTKTPTYSTVLAASGSSHHIMPPWEGSLYVKMNSTDSNAKCYKTYTGYSPNWPPLTSNSSVVPSLPSGISGITLSMWKDTSTGYYHLLADGCVTYYYSANTKSEYAQGASHIWRIIADTGLKTKGPCE